MTEAEWRECAEPKSMFGFLRNEGIFTERKARLFAVALCRALWHLLPDPRSQRAVLIGERFADGQASAEELNAAMGEAFDVTAELEKIDDGNLREFVCAALCAYDAAHEAECTEGTAAQAAATGRSETDPQTQASLVRCLFNPFLAVPQPLLWRTPTVVSVAQTIYDERRFSEMPILADALEDAGCSDADVLAHCRAEAPHVRGCWVLDLVLGKS
jgi:hypothetical protein